MIDLGGHLTIMMVDGDDVQNSRVLVAASPAGEKTAVDEFGLWCL